MHMCGIRDIPNTPTSEASKPLKTPYEVAKSILVPLGVYAQTQNDFFDYAGSAKEARKVGTDIITNKGSWCINAALVHATPEQRKILDEHYGRGESGGESESKVKAVFEEIGVREKYAEYEDQVVKMIRGRIAQLPETDEENTLRRELFETFLAKFYRRM
jgi:farnesyl diphosphate synthase